MSEEDRTRAGEPEEDRARAGDTEDVELHGERPRASEADDDVEAHGERPRAGT